MLFYDVISKSSICCFLISSYILLLAETNDHFQIQKLEMAAGVPSAADIALALDHTQAEHPNRYNLGLPFSTCYKESCLVRSNLMRCGGCRAVMYCTPQHQRADWPRHKNQCRLIKPAREELAAAEAALRAKAPKRSSQAWTATTQKAREKILSPAPSREAASTSIPVRDPT